MFIVLIRSVQWIVFLLRIVVQESLLSDISKFHEIFFAAGYNASWINYFHWALILFVTSTRASWSSGTEPYIYSLSAKITVATCRTNDISKYLFATDCTLQLISINQRSLLSKALQTTTSRNYIIMSSVLCTFTLSRTRKSAFQTTEAVFH
jgi:hypothetical protein